MECSASCSHSNGGDRAISWCRLHRVNNRRRPACKNLHQVLHISYTKTHISISPINVKKSLLPPLSSAGGMQIQMVLTGMMMMEEGGMRTAGSSSVFFRPCRRNSSCLKFESPPHCYRAQYYPLLCTLPHNVCVCSNLVCITAQCIPLQQCIPMHVNSVQIGRHSPQILS